jgi:4-hydroxy-3-methylbut-2-enyl diphosphate reductase
MSTEAPVASQKINLRRPDIMEAVQAQVLSHYRSELVERIRANGGVLSAGDLTIKLAKEFGFCYGVERAIDLAYAAKKYFSEVSPSTPIYLLGEIIHNPEVNDQISNQGIQIISPKPTEADIARLNAGDVVMIPAFGTEVGTRKRLEEKGCILVDTTCGDVMSVWKRVRQYSKDSVTSIIHGKAKHEETKATTSQARAYGSGHYLVVFNLKQTEDVCNYILHGGNKQEFLENFKGAYSVGFDPDSHLQAVGVANQTTMLRGETETVQRMIKDAMIQKFGIDKVDEHFRFFDTICGATQDRQDALEKLLRDPLDFLLVVGGYNSSNTSHLFHQERRENGAEQDRPLQAGSTDGSGNSGLAAIGQNHRRHHRRSFLPEQPDRRDHPPSFRAPRNQHPTFIDELIRLFRHAPHPA